MAFALRSRRAEQVLTHFLAVEQVRGIEPPAASVEDWNSTIELHLHITTDDFVSKSLASIISQQGSVNSFLMHLLFKISFCMILLVRMRGDAPVSSVEDLHSTVELHPQKVALGQLTAHLLIAGIFAFPMAPKVRYDLATFRLTSECTTYCAT